MSQPYWMDCDSLDDVPHALALRDIANGERHVVLRFATRLSDQEYAALFLLRAQLPDHSVFESGSTERRTQVTVFAVVRRSQVLAVRDKVIRAVESYRALSETLVSAYRANSLNADWVPNEHGWHVCFRHSRTGQTVEAPFREWVDLARVDPYFFADFVRTTPEHAAVAQLLRHDFQDAMRILEVVGVNASG